MTDQHVISKFATSRVVLFPAENKLVVQELVEGFWTDRLSYNPVAEGFGVWRRAADYAARLSGGAS